METAYARRGDTAVVEMADACGLERLPGGVRAASTASSRGLGEVMAAALDAGCRELVVGIGGSASTDGGAGLLAALGAVTSPAVPDGGAALAGVAALALDGLHPGLDGARVVVACDVDNPLTGPDGAAAVYGPQKGATPAEVESLDAALGHWADVVARSSGADRRDDPGAGAAGGVGFALVAALGAELRPGIALLLDLLGFADRVAGADLVVTGEGSLDVQSLRGKAPVGVAAAAGAAGVPVVAVCGRRLLSDGELAAGGIAAAYALLDSSRTWRPACGSRRACSRRSASGSAVVTSPERPGTGRRGVRGREVAEVASYTRTQSTFAVSAYSPGVRSASS